MDISDHIDALARSMDRVTARMDELERPFSFPADCCPWCACGPEWKALANKHQRQATWLAKLLRKRGADGDEQRARWLESEYDLAPRKVWRKEPSPEDEAEALGFDRSAV